MDAYLVLERIVADALVSADPVEAFRRGASDPRLSAELRRRLASAQPRGVRLAALLVARLRFERLVQGSALASEWFARDGHGFAAAFRQYHASVPALAEFPSQEAELFERWLGPRPLR